MQGQRGTIGSLQETIEFDTSSTAAVDQHIFWNNMRNPAENHFALPPSDLNPSYANPINHEWQNLSGWSLGEPSSSNTQNEVTNNEQKGELGLSSSISSGAIAGPRLEERRFEPNNTFPLDNVNTSSMYMRSSNSHLVPQNLNLNASLADSGTDNGFRVEHPPNLNKSSGPVNEHIQPSIGSSPFLLPSGTNGFLVEDTDGRPGCSLDTRRVSCKRKAVERSVGQSSGGGSSSYSQHTDGNTWNTLPTQDYGGSSFNRSASTEQVNARLGLSTGDGAAESIPWSNVAGSSESFHRNFRVRINPSSQQISVPPPAISSGSVLRNSGVSSSSPMLQRFHSVDNSLDLRSAPPVVDTMVPQSQPLVIHVPALPRNVHPFRWNGGSSSTNNHPSNTVICADRNNLPNEEASSRSVPRNMVEYPMFVPATNLRNVVRNPARASNSANLSIPGNVGSSSRAGSNSAVNPPSAPAWVSRPNPQQYPRRLSEYVRRSLFSPGLEAAGSSSNNYASFRGPSTSSGVNPFERQGDSEFGIQYSLRSLAAAGEGSSRLVSELRNVLGLMRRGGNLRFEDVMILDHSVFAGIADMHDRHRDMRLDVDNMSYEELLALEERIGNVSTGLSEETILKHMKNKKYSAEPGSQQEAEPCCVCQEEYKDGDDLGSLDCGHDYHTECIKQWLMHKNLCPICKTTGLAT
ncbi:probable E3 ubiquitin-protein ligase RHG1A isoform X2 [Vigna umbellata]|uniref:probable E3 ubiquitin-protein ligase RHG1A isoform X2 n=1 Tax=Vigna umbellata TaxID=87088 RepID=UPI001F5F7E35|nr:probable E3 ubiquitin-protein ligase RHG1A isoform X2 [Vigna umbellata]